MTLTTPEAVAKGAELMAAAERALVTAQKKLAGLPAVFAAVRDGDNPDMPEGATPLGGLETMELSARARALAGEIAAAELAVVSFHRHLTARAQELGIDLPTILSGGR